MENQEKSLHYLQWHITHTCNLRCAHCYQDTYTESMSETELEQILRQYCAFLKERNLRGQINLTGGEPLLNPGFFPLAEKIKAANLQLDMS